MHRKAVPMVPALIVMTILGCDDGVTQCHYVSTVKGTWETVATCDAESQKQLPKFANSNYPVIVAVCEKPDESLAENAPPGQQSRTDQSLAATSEAVPNPPAVDTVQRSLPRRTLALVTGAFPDRAKLRDAVVKPVHYIEDGYSWVARRFAK